MDDMIFGDMADKMSRLIPVCRRHEVRSLELFGSAVQGTFDPDRSDLDFLVEFENATAPGIADRFFGLKEDLEELFGRPVDLVEVTAIRNPYFLGNINQSRVLVYTA